MRRLGVLLALVLAIVIALALAGVLSVRVELRNLAVSRPGRSGGKSLGELRDRETRR